ncbi:flagellar basal body-associated FliL family protein [Mobilicoccus pelagius]|uniref:Flagellar protein FliL n=1 Tax=Mobilicoccus pelagius NBRC 104925 TaxID=1089455 RepID=H5UQY7_9MICO|nr:flagellar basal body-associated FliL family protein [Mobilicoccus pelagius]GAB48145.1 putative flagellar basal body-associated protein FliL [Mobilicoccus pelagius NBRC 104925]
MSEAATEEAPKSKTKLIIIVAAALAVVLAALGVVAFMLLGGKDDKEAGAAPETGVVVPLKDEMTLNLADGKFLKIQLALQLTKEATETAGEKAADTFDGSKAQDAAISVFSTYKYNDLLDAKTKEEARKKLAAEVKKRYDGEVMDVYYRQFVMQ